MNESFMSSDAVKGSFMTFEGEAGSGVSAG
jgi:hypothetical protein